MARHALPGSERQPLPGARCIGPAHGAAWLEVSVILKSNDADALRQAAHAQTRVERDDFAALYGARQEHIDAVAAFALAHGLGVVEANAARRTVLLSGPVVGYNKAFGVDLQLYDHPSGTYRGRTGPVHVPDELKDAVEAVLGLDNRPIARSHVRRRADRDNARAHDDDGATTSFSPTVLASLYDFPVGDGAGVTVGIIELGGGYRVADLQAYFAGLGLVSWPELRAVSVDSGMNAPTGDPTGDDGEVMLDIEVVGAIAPAAKLVVYFAPNTDAGFLDALTTAAHDTTNRPSVISISWGGPECDWTPQAMSAFDTALQGAAALGITVCVASGDSGSSDGADDGADHVDFPASSPHALACGGTSLQAADLAITGETGWNDGASGGAGGGGVSSVFALPPWQGGLRVVKAGHSAPLAMRGVPDVSGNADPETGYDVLIDGGSAVLGGTSAVAPLWAGLIARINAAKGGSVGFVSPDLYRSAAAMRDITQGGNGDFTAAVGWDACTGVGSPNGTDLMTMLQVKPAR